jgi:hypothetical protein
MIKQQLTFSQFRELHKKGYSADIALFLQYIEEGEDVNEIAKDVPKLGNIVQSLRRKGLITEDNKVTLEGKEILSFLSTKESKKIVKKKKGEDHDFLLWWSHYPSTDDFTHKGRHFAGTRGLRSKKDDCRIKLNKILGEGQFTLEEMIKALDFEVEQKKENSVKTGQNKLSYLQNSMTYLNQYSYENYIDLIRKGTKMEKSPQTDYDGVNI